MTTALQTTDNNNLANILFDNLGGALSASDLLRVKMPAGGGIAFEIPAEDGESDVTKAIEGVIIAHTPLRQYFTEINNVRSLNCMSNDGLTGSGTPGGKCANCQFNQWGSKGKGKACTEKAVLYIRRDDDILPITVTLPPTSLKTFRKFMVDLSLKRLPFYGVKAKLTLKKQENNDGGFYSIVQFASLGALDAAEFETVRAFRESFLPLLAQAAQADEPEAPVVDSFTLNADGSVTDPASNLTF